MLERIKEYLRAAPFVPFKILTSDGREYLVPTSDHAFVPPLKYSRVIVFDDADHETHLSVLHIVGVERTVVSAG
jgi:hypothetical protein